jgi:enamine deaminase RidA (YjgF/YER057c/UK114 family)
MDIVHLRSPDAPSPLAHYSQGVRLGDFVLPAGQIASDYRTGVPPEARADPAFPYYGSTIKRQAAYVLKNITAVLKEAGCGLEQVVKAQVFLRELDQFAAFDETWKELFPSPPPRTTVQVGPQGLLVPGCEVEIDLVAVHPERGPFQVLSSGGAPMPLAHYAPGIQTGAFIFLAGGLASDFRTGVPPEARSDPAFPYYSANIERQTSFVLNNLESVLSTAGAGLADTVKAQVFLTDVADFDGFHQVWRERLPALPPLSLVPVRGLLVPGTIVEIDLVAVAPNSGSEPRRITVDGLPEPHPGGSCAIVAEPFVFAAGQMAADYRSGVVPEGRVNPHSPYLGTDIALQTEVVLGNLARLLEAAGSSLERVVKTQVFLTDLNLFYQFDKVWKRHFPTPPPRTTVQIGGPSMLLPGALVMVDAVAAL